MRNYKLPGLLLMVLIVMVVMTGCQSDVTVEEEAGTETEAITEGELERDESDDPGLVVTTSFFPYYDMVKQLGGEGVEVYQMVPDGADPHSYEPTPRDLIQLEASNLFIYNGVGFENWIEGAISLLSGTDTLVMKAEDYVTLLPMLADDDHEETHDEDTEEEDEHLHGAYDPHLWTDPVNMKKVAGQVMAALVQMDPSSKEIFEDNYAAYAAALDELDISFKEVSEEAGHHELLVSHSAFGYLAHRYGFQEIAVTGISPHGEPNPGRLAELTDLARSHELEYIFFETLANPRTAEILAAEAGLTPLMLYNVEGLTKEQKQSGEGYITLMEENVKTLRKALVK